MSEIWFWQLIISPHMAHLAVALANLGFKVTYVTETHMSADRSTQGWKAPEMPGVDLVYADSKAAVRMLVGMASKESIHICQGIRANNLVSVAQQLLAKHGLRQWVVMETVDDSGWKGFLKRIEYDRLFWLMRNALQGVLAIGYKTPAWVIQRGMPTDKVYPFAYFLPNSNVLPLSNNDEHRAFRLIFVGRLISLKRVNWLIKALSLLVDNHFELWIVGSGPEERSLKEMSINSGFKINWLGMLPLEDVPFVMSQADCLVLPSEHDGWGAVLSEALMCGTPVVCSDACGAAGVVRSSGFGGVFSRNNFEEFQSILKDQIEAGLINTEKRQNIISWATSLNADSGASYLVKIINYANSGGIRPITPWNNESFKKCAE